MPAGVEIGVDDHEDTSHHARDHAGHQKFRYRGAGGGAVDDKHNGGRDHNAQRTACNRQSGCIALRILFLDQLGVQHTADGSGGGNGGAGQRCEHHADSQNHDRQSTADMS